MGGKQVIMHTVLVLAANEIAAALASTFDVSTVEGENLRAQMQAAQARVVAGEFAAIVIGEVNSAGVVAWVKRASQHIDTVVIVHTGLGTLTGLDAVNLDARAGFKLSLLAKSLGGELDGLEGDVTMNSSGGIVVEQDSFPVVADGDDDDWTNLDWEEYVPEPVAVAPAIAAPVAVAPLAPVAVPVPQTMPEPVIVAPVAVPVPQAMPEPVIVAPPAMPAPVAVASTSALPPPPPPPPPAPVAPTSVVTAMPLPVNVATTDIVDLNPARILLDDLDISTDDSGPPLGKIVIVASPKGDAGKTTMTLNLALLADRRGLKSLAVDGSPFQAGFYPALGISERAGEPSIADYVPNVTPLRAGVSRGEGRPNWTMDVLLGPPTKREKVQLQNELSTRLVAALREARKTYDVIFVELQIIESGRLQDEIGGVLELVKTDGARLLLLANYTKAAFLHTPQLARDANGLNVNGQNGIFLTGFRRDGTLDVDTFREQCQRSSSFTILPGTTPYSLKLDDRINDSYPILSTEMPEVEEALSGALYHLLNEMPCFAPSKSRRKKSRRLWPRR
jgi:Mrp family chromosome partitioning ATPase